MKENPVKATLKAGGVALGSSVIEFATPGLPRIAAACGVDFLLFDTEHNGWTSETLRPLLAVCRGTQVVPLVRVDGLDYRQMGTSLDLGAMGIMVPMVETGEQASRIVEYARYPPNGRRGAAFGIAHDDYTPSDRATSMESADREALLIALVESERGVENIDEIAAVEGIDVIWIGQSDLTISLGIVGQFDHPRYLAAVDEVVDAAIRHGKALGFTGRSIEDAREALRRGFRCISYSSDVKIYQQALAGVTRDLRRATAPGAGGEAAIPRTEQE